MSVFYNNKVLSIFAHPDDAEITSYGTLLKLKCEYMCDVTTLILTEGENSSRSEKNKNRINEAIESANTVDFKILKENFIDGDLKLNINLVKTIENYIDKIKPEIIITHYPQSIKHGHQDHLTVSEIVINICNRRDFVSFVLLSQPPRFIKSFNPNLFINIDNYFEKKFNSIKCHNTEKGKLYLSREFIENQNKFWANQVFNSENKRNITYCEAFFLYKGILV